MDWFLQGAKRLAILDICLFFLTLVVSITLEWSLFHSVPISIQFLFVDPNVTTGKKQTTNIFIPIRVTPDNADFLKTNNLKAW